MKKILRNIGLVLGAVFLAIACTEEKHGPIESDSLPVSAISNLQIKPTPGGAELTYTLPTSTSLSHVMAEVTFPDGKVKQFVSSQYTTTIIVEGLPELTNYPVKVYAVNRSNVPSDAVESNFTCLEPPYLDVFKSLAMKADFGGVNVKWGGNLTESKLGVVLMANDSLGDFVQYGSEYSTLVDLSHSFRGMKSESNRFGAFIKDRYGNVSDTLYAELTPLFESLISKANFKEHTLPGDAAQYPASEATVGFRYIWDDVYSVNYAAPYMNYRSFISNDPRPLPLHITFDLGKQYLLTRMRLNNYYQFQNRGVKKYEIWGHAGTPPSDGSWDGWVKLGEHEQFKPSGNTFGPSNVTEADKRYWEAGDMVQLNGEVGPIRYIRFRALSNWSGTLNFNLMELTFWGSDKL
ncbi:DUF5000 domain-containing lipoprotein [Sphingobacterium hotanense]|uniref:DUF5000 domain-containing lipoprotein n=1 Tax=Sphingobacterium hotanense TaxID=649196 RepID=UPI0021A46CCC|nr:DUF5000 domain-containing lipoprotein [Sphingobacterium hotanense]MCT1523997.1 DUF5126 domain-containing protein [Sphingobacterium hotanense]